MADTSIEVESRRRLDKVSCEGCAARQIFKKVGKTHITVIPRLSSNMTMHCSAFQSFVPPQVPLPETRCGRVRRTCYIPCPAPATFPWTACPHPSLHTCSLSPFHRIVTPLAHNFLPHPRLSTHGSKHNRNSNFQRSLESL